MIRRLAALALGLSCAAGCASNEVPNRPEEIAMAYAKAGRHPEAAREIELAVRAQPENVALRQHAASIQADAGDLDKAVEHLEVAIQLAPFDPESWIALAELEKRRGSPADSYVAYRRAAELAPDDLRAVSGLALAADSLGFDEEADRAYARWTELQRWREPLTPPPARP
jgi:tetratricopeptide (TPR) repeat protein